ncbi:hypothetical protein HAP94_24875 [Acidithiobacillus ferrivorans]|nr:hypothetical protein [Acidithiobacillus ferrivorans]
MTYSPPSLVYIPGTVLRFGQQASKYKTPCIRTRGATEAPNQLRGEPDWIDTVATLMLWRELVLAGMPVTYLLTANGGDETDLRVQVKGDPYFIDINVKGTKASVPAHSNAAAYGNLPLKCEELGLTLTRIDKTNYKPHQEGVRIELRDGVPWAIADNAERLADIYIKIFVHAAPLTDEHCAKDVSHIHFTNWLPVEGKDFAAQLKLLNESIAAGTPPKIPGINHPGMWIQSRNCRPYEDLFAYLEKILQQHGAPDFILRWKRIDKQCLRHRMKVELDINTSQDWFSFDADVGAVSCNIPPSSEQLHPNILLWVELQYIL